MKKAKPVLFMLIFSGFVLFLILLLQPLEILKFQDYIAVLFPKGSVGVEQRNLLLIIQAIMLLVVIPVYILTFIFSWKYRAFAPKEDYDPDIVDSVVLEYIWWGLPLVLTALVAVLTWIRTHELDPYKPLVSDKKPKTIQVVAMQWKWLFLYPEEKIASMNFLQIPVDTPIKFEITADAPMNSFWVPELGGQIYAMAGMKTELNLIANHTGDFRGSSANISGEGFADMHFITRSSTQEDYDKWIAEASKTSKKLNLEEYNRLVPQSRDNPPEQYQLADEKLFHQIIHKFMHPQEKK